ncbi:MAG: hypothetical protein K0U66_00875, partial [Gammaproteobacteria bacterium]|nr:hypothetical protein [Gammaproteobacteria bacterium]
PPTASAYAITTAPLAQHPAATPPHLPSPMSKRIRTFHGNSASISHLASRFRTPRTPHGISVCHYPTTPHTASRRHTAISL